jgi:hypothetical protein
MGLESFSCAKAKGMEAHHRTPLHQQALPKVLYENGDAKRLKYIAKPNDHFVSFDLKDGFYALSIHPKDREAFRIYMDGQLLQ